jgi:hypothetical protein
LVQLLTNFEVSGEMLQNTLYISKSYLLRIIKKMNTTFVHLDLKIETNELGFHLDGNEQIIRLLTFLIFYDSTDLKCSDTPQTHRENGESFFSKKGDELDDSRKNSLSLLLSSILSRIDQGKMVDKPTTIELNNFFEHLTANYDVSQFLNNNNKALEKLLNNKEEILFLNFIARVFCADIIPEKKKIAVAQTNQSSYFFNLANSLTEDVFKSFPSKFSIDETFLLEYFLSIGLAYHSLVGDKIFHLYEYAYDVPNFHIPIKNRVSTNISLILDKFALTNKIDFLQEESIKQVFIDLMSTMVEIHTNGKLKIYIQTSRNCYTSKVLEDLILSMFNKQKIHFTTHSKEADLIITDKFEPEFPTSNIYFFDSLQNQGQWLSLLQKIQSLLLNNVFATDTLKLEDLLEYYSPE